MADPLKDAVVRRDAAFVAGWLSGRWMIDVTPERAARWIEQYWRFKDSCRQAHLESRGLRPESEQVEADIKMRDWSGATIDLWFRARMTEERGYEAGEGRRYAIEHGGRFFVPLHVGFINIEETEEMLELLRLYDNSDPKLGGRGLATPGIERTEVKVEPIDRTAAKVVGINTGDLR